MVILKLKTVNNEVHDVEADPSDTIGKVKEEVAKRLNVEKKYITLIFSGNIMSDDRTVESYNVKNYIILLVKKPQEPQEEKKPVAQPQVSSAPPQQQTQSQPAEGQPQNEQDSPLLTQEQFAARVNQIADMGFSREQVLLALRASFGNVDRAVEYLSSGNFPANVAPRNAQQVGPSGGSTQVAQPPQNIQPPNQPAPTRQFSPIFEQLRQHPQFPQLCLIVQQGGPQALTSIFQYLSQVQPELISYISEHQEEFTELLNTPVRVVQSGHPSQGVAPAQQIQNQERFQVTPEQEQVINNFVALGFDRRRVLEAYFLFDKDEQMTADYLFNNPEDQQ